MKRIAPLLLLLVAACSSADESGREPVATTSPIVAETTSTSTPSSTTTNAPASTSPPTTANNDITVVCDTNDPEPRTFEVPLGSEVTLIARSTEEREYHLHGYDIELAGTEVTFQFTATIAGPSELTEHPGHSTVCTINS